MSDAKDIEVGEQSDLGDDDIRRLEWQANQFPSCLLLPRDALIKSAVERARRMDLRDHGYGLIFVDHQHVNIHNYHVFTTALMEAYQVSRTAVRIRLKSLGLLNDSWM